MENAQGRLRVENPFRNEEILQRLSQFCDFEGLKTFRLVNKSCYQESLKRWRQLAVLVVSDRLEGSNGLFVADLEKMLEEPFSKSSDLLRLGRKPFSSYRLQGWNINEETYRVWKRFWDHVTPHIKYLQLDKCSLDAVTVGVRREVPPGGMIRRRTVVRYPFLERIIFPVAGNIAPNLEELILTNNKFWGKYDAVVQFPGNVQNLKLKLLEVFQKDFPFPMNVLLPRLPNLQNISGIPTESDFINKLPLKTICLDFNHHPLHEDILRNNDFLDKLECVTVYKLPERIRTRRHRWEPARNLPEGQPKLGSYIFENLKEFYIWGHRVTQDFNFLQSTPNLQVLKINLLCFERRNEFKEYLAKQFLPSPDSMMELSQEMNGVHLDGLFHLEIDFQFSVENFQVLKEWMPNLAILKTILNNETFRVVCQQWSGTIRELALLYGSDVNDEGIIGSSTTTPETDQHRLPNITNLRNLLRFSLDSYCNQAKLGDASVHHGFLQMPHLNYVRICVSEQMSEEAICSLKDQVPLVKIIRNYGLGPHDGYDCCDRLEFYLDAIPGAREATRRPPSTRQRKQRNLNG